MIKQKIASTDELKNKEMSYEKKITDLIQEH